MPSVLSQVDKMTIHIKQFSFLKSHRNGHLKRTKEIKFIKVLLYKKEQYQQMVDSEGFLEDQRLI